MIADTAAYFRLHRHYDRTGTFDLGEDVGLGGGAAFPMEPGTEYVAPMGALAVDDPFLDDDTVADEALAAAMEVAPSMWVEDLRGLLHGQV